MLVPSRKAPCDRRFTMRDAMILVASAGAGLAILAPLQEGPLKVWPQWSVYLAYYNIGLLALTPTALTLRLIGPRPLMHRLARQPGFAASVAGSTILALGVLATGILTLVRLIKDDLGPSSPPPLNPMEWAGIVLYFTPIVGPSILATWVMLAVSGHRRPVASWLDYLGRGIGVGWIILFVIETYVRLAP
jgi:hypothetical protein